MHLIRSSRVGTNLLEMNNPALSTFFYKLCRFQIAPEYLMQKEVSRYPVDFKVSVVIIIRGLTNVT